MSLDVYLTMSNDAIRLPRIKGSGIFVREDGSIKEIFREEWDEKRPGIEPIIVTNMDVEEENVTAYQANITHNLNKMAKEADIYDALWRPETVGIVKAYQLITPLHLGLDKLKDDPEHFKRFDAPNEWGTYPDFVRFVKEYLAACEQFPDADVSVWR